MKPPVFLFLALGVMLAGCGTPVIPQCPSAAVLSDTSVLTVFRAGAPHDLSGEAYTAAIDAVKTTCKYPKASPIATSTLSFTLRAIRAPSPDGADYTLPYYLALTQGDRILSKKNLSVHLIFPPGSAAASQDVALDDTVVTLEPGHPPTDYQLLVGFQLTDAERAYNQTRGRFAMTSIAADLSAALGRAFAAEGLAAGFGQVVLSDRPDLCQFQCNGALAAAKQAKLNPRDIAGKIVARLKADARFSRIEIAGPGFINLDLSDAAMAELLAAQSVAPDSPANARTAVIDFGGYNIAKPLHVGHLRSSIIGDCLTRLYRANGWRVIGDVHLGDWGLQMGQLISEIGLRGLAPVYFDAGFSGPYPEISPVTMEDLEEIYPAASAACKADPARLDLARRATVDLQDGRPGYRALWRHFVQVSEVGLARETASLGVTFDLWNGESSVQDMIAPMLDDLKARGVAQTSEGALVLPVAEEGDKKPMPPLMLVKTEGGVLYGTTDLATIVERVRDYDPDLILYVVDQRQHLHFEQVFRAARKAGLAGRAQLEHAGFGTMNGPDGKPFKTRAGGVMKLHDLIAMATVQANSRLAEQGLGADYSAEEKAQIARQVGLATIKFADLSNHRATDYIFDLERFSKFEGKTGPYLQYASVRIQSILRKAQAEGHAVGAPAIHSPEERALVLQILFQADIMLAAEAKRAPNILCDYAFELAQKFSRFYAEHHILSESDLDLRARRLGLCARTLGVLRETLALLGIAVPERM